jgi:hypothetical protein
VGDRGLRTLARLPNLRYLYLTETKVTPSAVEVFQKAHARTFVSWAGRSGPRGAPLQGVKNE